MKIRKKALKNWNKEEINHLKRKLEKVKKHPHAKIHEQASYWLVLLLCVITSFIAAIALSTISMVLELYVLLAITIALALGFGSIFSLWINELEEIEVKHHVTFFLVVILSSTMSFTFVFSTPIITLLSESRYVLPTTIFYVLFFTIPYMMKLTEEYHERLDHPIRENKRHFHKTTKGL